MVALIPRQSGEHCAGRVGVRVRAHKHVCKCSSKGADRWQLGCLCRTGIGIETGEGIPSFKCKTAQTLNRRLAFKVMQNFVFFVINSVV